MVLAGPVLALNRPQGLSSPASCAKYHMDEKGHDKRQSPAKFSQEQARQCRASGQDRSLDLKVRSGFLQLAKHYEQEAQKARLALARRSKARRNSIESDWRANLEPDISTSEAAERGASSTIHFGVSTASHLLRERDRALPTKCPGDAVERRLQLRPSAVAVQNFPVIVPWAMATTIAQFSNVCGGRNDRHLNCIEAF
jgi:hypothetical protein